MSNSYSSDNSSNESARLQLPLASIARALCQAAMGGSDKLYEVMIKLTLMIDATAHTYVLSSWTQIIGELPRVEWLEGLYQTDIGECEGIDFEGLSETNYTF